MKKFFVLFAVVGLGLSSCERHTWETEGGGKPTDTINLFKHDESHDKDAEHPEEGEKPDH